MFLSTADVAGAAKGSEHHCRELGMGRGQEAPVAPSASQPHAMPATCFCWPSAPQAPSSLSSGPPSTGLSVHPREGGSSYLQVSEQALEQGVKAVTLELIQGAQEVL